MMMIAIIIVKLYQSISRYVQIIGIYYNGDLHLYNSV